jgi:lipocalin
MRLDKSRICAPGVGALALALALGLAGCAGSEPATSTAPIAITDLASITGKWVGLLEIAGSRDREDYLEVTIASDGTYRAASARTIGILDAKGTVTVADGRLLIQGASGGKGTAVLYSQPGQSPRMLQVNGTAGDGRPYIARLRPQS